MKTKIICLGTCFALFLAACGGKKNYEIARSTADSASTLSKTDTSVNTPKLVKTASMHFKVKNVQHTCEDVSVLATSYNGLVMHHAMQSSVVRSYNTALSTDSVMHVSSYTTTADMVVRVPSEKMEEFMNQVGKMAVYTDTRNMDIQDLTFDYLSSNMKVQSRSEIIAQQKTNNIKIKNAESVMALKDDLIDQRISNKRIDYAVKYSTIGLSFYQTNTIAKEIVINDDPSNFRVPFFAQLKNSMAAGWSGFNDVIIFLANLWVLFLLGAIVWYGYVLYKKKQMPKAV
ncbi:DUF4349 domain-containing protein [Mucilaginibacter sp. AW1-3]